MNMEAKKTRTRYFILLMITFMLTLATGDRATLSVAGPEMQKELGITAVEIGYLFSAFSWAYVISMTPAGWVADKVGSKRAMFLGILLWSVVTVFMGLVSLRQLELGLDYEPVLPEVPDIVY